MYETAECAGSGLSLQALRRLCCAASDRAPAYVCACVRTQYISHTCHVYCQGRMCAVSMADEASFCTGVRARRKNGLLGCTTSEPNTYDGKRLSGAFSCRESPRAHYDFTTTLGSHNCARKRNRTAKMPSTKNSLVKNSSKINRHQGRGNDYFQHHSSLITPATGLSYPCSHRAAASTPPPPLS